MFDEAILTWKAEIFLNTIMKSFKKFMKAAGHAWRYFGPLCEESMSDLTNVI